jgi:SAM-dependent methyltransferase
MLDYAAIYDENYYLGRGADPLVDYVEEVEHPETTIRRYEWRGVLARVASLVPVNASTQWLDFGCGMGGLVSYLRALGFHGARGFEHGWCIERLRAGNVPIITSDELEKNAGVFDVITAIEVIEHTVDPVAELRQLRALLKPGGLLFLTTGNARPHRQHLERWGYIVPEVHVSFFEPSTLALAMRSAGFEPAFPGFGPGWTDIIRFKILKNLRRRSTSLLEAAVPWAPVTRIIDRRMGISCHPVAWVKADA